MKKIIILFFGIFLFYCSNGNGINLPSHVSESSRSSLRISSTPDLAELIKTWGCEFKKENPQVNVEVIILNSNLDNSSHYGDSDLLFVSNENQDALPDDSIWKMVVGRKVIVPIISSKNPWRDKINHGGISSEELARLFTNTGNSSWGTLLGNGQEVPVHYYTVNSDIIRSHVAAFLTTDPGIIKGVPVKNGKEMISAIQKDPYGIGFCELNDILDLETQGIASNIRLLPIDKNKNGRIDYFENIYGDLNDFMRGVWIGKYPKSLCSAIYSIAPRQSQGGNRIAFLTWVLNEGQRFLNPVGYSDLAFSDGQKKKLDMLAGAQPSLNISSGGGFFINKLNDVSVISFIIIILIPFLLGYMTIEALVRDKRRKKATEAPVATNFPRFFNENSVMIPNGLFFDQTHTWVFMEKNGKVRLGIDDFLQHITGTLTSIKMKKRGEKIKKGELLLSVIQNGKQLNIYAPISGMISEQNELLVKTPSFLNTSPYNDGWVYMIEPAGWLKEIRFLAMAEKYKEWLKKEFSRLKDLLALTLKGNRVEYNQIILQDGGEIKDGILAEFGPEVWEDFQTNFIDKSC